VLIPIWGVLGATVAYTVPRLVSFVFYTALCHRLLHLRARLGPLVRIALATAVMGGVVLLGQRSGVQWLWLACLVGPATYAVALLLVGELKLQALQLPLRA
jgi:O-antigen/teichoic acid export membrane protein